MIDALAIAKVIASLMGCWALGYGVGQSVAWCRRLVNAA